MGLWNWLTRRNLKDPATVKKQKEATKILGNDLTKKLERSRTKYFTEAEVISMRDAKFRAYYETHKEFPHVIIRLLENTSKAYGKGKNRVLKHKWKVEIDEAKLKSPDFLLKPGTHGGGTGGVATWAIILGANGFGPAVETLLKKGFGYSLYLEGLVLFSDFMREEATQTSQFSLMVAGEDKDLLVSCLQQHYQLLSFIIYSRWWIWMSINEKAFSLFFISAINLYKTNLKKLIKLLIKEYVTLNVEAYDKNGNVIPASIYINDRFQFVETPQTNFIPLDIGTGKSIIKVTLRAQGYKDVTRWYWVIPNDNYISLKKSLGKVTLGVIEGDAATTAFSELGINKDIYINGVYDEALSKATINGDGATRIPLSDTLRDIIMNTRLRGTPSLVNKIHLESRGPTHMKFKISVDNNNYATWIPVDAEGNEITSSTQKQAVELSLASKIDSVFSKQNLAITEESMKNLLTNLERIENSSDSDDTKIENITDYLTKNIQIQKNISIESRKELFSNPIHEQYTSTLEFQWGNEENYNKSKTLNEDEWVEDYVSEIDNVNKRVLEDSPSLNFHNAAELAHIAIDSQKPLLIKTKSKSLCNGTIDVNDEFELGVQKEWAFSAVTDVFYLQQYTKNPDVLIIKREPRLEEMQSPYEIYDQLKCGGPITAKWIELTSEGKVVVSRDSKSEEITELKDKFTDSDYKLGNVTMKVIMEEAVYDLHPVTFVADCVTNGSIYIDNSNAYSGDLSTGVVLNIPYGDFGVKFVDNNTQVSKFNTFNFTSETKTEKFNNSDVVVLHENRFCAETYTPSKEEYPFKVIVECVNDADILIDKLWVGKSGTAGKSGGYITNIPYGWHTIETQYGGVSYEEYVFFDSEVKPDSRYDAKIPTFIQDKYCTLLNEETERVKFKIIGVKDASISIDGYYVGTSGKEIAYFNMTPKENHRIRISAPGYYDRVVDFGFNDTTPFITYPDGTKENMHTFYYNFTDNKMTSSTYSGSSGSIGYYWREQFPTLYVRPANAILTFTDTENGKVFSYLSGEPIKDLPAGREYILLVSADTYDNFEDKLFFEKGFKYPDNIIILNKTKTKNKCTC